MIKWISRLRIILVTVLIMIMSDVACTVTSAETESSPDNQIESGNSVSFSLPDTEKALAESGKYMLTFNDVNYLIKVIDKTTGFVWATNPPDARDDEVAEGMTKTNMLSHIVVSYAPVGMESKDTNSMAGSISYEGASWKRIDNGIRVTYAFEREKFVIPLEFILEEDGLKVSILYDEIIEKDNKILSIALLPYFGAVNNDKDGYLFIPDGSGAVVRFASDKSGVAQTYEKTVFGDDLTVSQTQYTSRAQAIHIPVFGMKNGEHAFLGVISEGEANARISAAAAGQTSGYFNVYSSGVYRQSGRVYLTTQTSSIKDTLFLARTPTKSTRYTVKYFFLEGEQADYIGMADLYRDRLIEQGLIRKTSGSAKLFVDFYGSVLKGKSFLGIPYQAKEKLTTLDQAQMILERMKEQGVGEIVAVFKQFTNEALSGKPDIGVLPMKNLGGKKAFRSLSEFAAGQGIHLFPHADILSFKKSGNGISRFNGAAYSLEKSPVKVYPFGINTNFPNKSVSPLNLIKPPLYEKAVKRLVQNMEKYEIPNVSLGDISSRLVSDFAGTGSLREQTLAHLLDSVSILSEKKQVMTSAPNSYLFPLSDIITDLPLESSQHILFDQDIPFLQILLKGYLDYSGEAVNISNSSDAVLLRHIEMGANVKFANIYKESSSLLRTDALFLSGATYTGCLEKSVEWYKEVQTLMQATGRSKIVNYHSDGTLVKVEYENRLCVYVNYFDSDILKDGVVIHANSYALKRGVKD